jgi:light-regulated signal transduction histidine kinase (bacteriophytochrome)/ActR/RegA family two-component response regulator
MLDAYGKSLELVPAADIPIGSLANCDHISFQHTNLIQPHVAFLYVDSERLNILNASTNTMEVLGLEFERVWNARWDDDLLLGASNLLKNAHERARELPNAMLDRSLVNLRGEPLLARISNVPDRWLIELERQTHPADLKFVDFGALQSTVGEILDRSQRLEDLSFAIAAMRQLLEVDHCLLYRFDAENNGEVIAEACSSRNAQRYLGLRFPTRDVPLSARKMMLNVPARSAVDQSIDCIPIHPRRDPITGQHIDLTSVRARGSVKSCQAFYANLGVRAKLVLPLKANGKLWGMIVCHHHDPLRISPVFDPYLTTISRMMGYAIERITQTTIRNAELRGRQAIRDLSQEAENLNDSLKHLQLNLANLKNLIPCGGFILRIAGTTLTSGVVPNESEITSLLNALWKAADGHRLATNCLPRQIADMHSIASNACGVIAVPLGIRKQDTAVWIRPEQSQQVNWAGNPNENVHFDVQGSAYLSPRESFDTWKSQTRGTSVSWTEEEIALADSASMQLSLVIMGWYAAQANIDKGEFFACMSHELRTPLTAILGYADLLGDECNTPDSQDQKEQYIDTIRRNGIHLMKVVDDVLDMAKIESGKMTVENIRVDIESLVRDAILLMKARADEKQLSLKLSFKTNVPKYITTDPVRLRQILLNLAGNAIKFTQSGSVTLVVSMDSSRRDQMVFEIVDTGIGMSPQQQSRLFNAFAQADSSTTRQYGGSGLGLMISKNLSQMLGGDISISSTPGEGSTFRVHITSGIPDWSEFISCESDVALTPARSIQPTRSASPNDPTIRGVRILLMEDGIDNQRLIAFHLRKAGALVTIVDNGKIGIESLTTDSTIDGPLIRPLAYDVILTDMQMPEMDGYTAARLLRDKGCETPIIALTAFAMKSDAKKCIAAGCNDYLSKPLKKVDLLEKVAKWGAFEPTATLPRLDLTFPTTNNASAEKSTS